MEAWPSAKPGVVAMSSMSLLIQEKRVAVITVLFHNPAISLKRLSLIKLTEFFRISEYVAHEIRV